MMAFKMTPLSKMRLVSLEACQNRVPNPANKKAKPAKASVAFKFIGRTQARYLNRTFLYLAHLFHQGVEGLGKRNLAEEVIGQHDWTQIPRLTH